MANRKKHTRIRNLQDIRLAKSECKYEILQDEVAFSDSVRQFRQDFRDAIREAMIRYGTVLAVSSAMKFIRSRNNK